MADAEHLGESGLALVGVFQQSAKPREQSGNVFHDDVPDRVIVYAETDMDDAIACPDYIPPGYLRMRLSDVFRNTGGGFTYEALYCEGLHRIRVCCRRSQIGPCLQCRTRPFHRNQSYPAHRTTTGARSLGASDINCLCLHVRTKLVAKRLVSHKVHRVFEQVFQVGLETESISLTLRGRQSAPVCQCRCPASPHHAQLSRRPPTLQRRNAQPRRSCALAAATALHPCLGTDLVTFDLCVGDSFPGRPG